MIILKSMSIKFMKDTDVLETIHGHTGNIFKDNIPSEFTELSEQAQEYKKPADTGQKWWKQKFTKDIWGDHQYHQAYPIVKFHQHRK